MVNPALTPKFFWRLFLVLTSGGTKRAKVETIAHGFVDLCPVAPFVGRQSHHRLMDHVEIVDCAKNRISVSLFVKVPRPCETLSCLYAQSMGWRSTELRGLTPTLHTEPLMHSHTR